MNTPNARLSIVRARSGFSGKRSHSQWAAALGVTPTAVYWWRDGGLPKLDTLQAGFARLAQNQPWIKDANELAKWVCLGGTPPAWLELDDRLAPQHEVKARPSNVIPLKGKTEDWLGLAYKLIAEAASREIAKPGPKDLDLLDGFGALERHMAGLRKNGTNSNDIVLWNKTQTGLSRKTKSA